jgi:hypothetical protein
MITGTTAGIITTIIIIRGMFILPGAFYITPISPTGTTPGTRGTRLIAQWFIIKTPRFIMVDIMDTIYLLIVIIPIILLTSHYKTAIGVTFTITVTAM